MKRFLLLLTALLLFELLPTSRADSIWDRRDPRTSHLFLDNRARKVGDVLTIVVREVTLFDGKEDRKLKKETKNNIIYKLLMNYQAGEETERTFSGNFDSQASTLREHNGKADYKSDRTFTDRVSVQVVKVMPNGNLVVEGYRKRIIADEERTLLISGIVRPADIGPGNVVQSQYVANFTISYRGKGGETSYLQNGWFGRILNYIWPF